jgi:hypothetical protein
MREWLIEFGCTPSARSRLRIERPQQELDPLEVFLRGSAAQKKNVN